MAKHKDKNGGSVRDGREPEAEKKGAGPRTATPDQEIKRLQRAQRADKRRLRELEQRIKNRGDRIEDWRDLDASIERLDSRGVVKPWLVYVEAERADAAVGGLQGVDFVALCVAVLERETGIPQRNIFGCDHGPQGGSLPYCNDPVTPDRINALVAALKDPARRFAAMNGVGWTQLTWYEKVLRADALPGGAEDPVNQMRVGFGDLAVLIKDRGLTAGVKGYNGDGPAADAYAADVVGEKYPRWKTWDDKKSH